MSQGTPRKFSEKIAIMQRKQNEDEDAFAKVMRDVRTITSTDADGTVTEVPPTQQLAPGQWNRPGGSLPNVHQMVQHQPVPWGYWDPSQVQRGRSPGASSHYHPYTKPRSQERVPPLHYYPQQPQQHLQAPDNWNTFYRARSDPAIHSSHMQPMGMNMPPAYGQQPGPMMPMQQHPQMHPHMIQQHNGQMNGPMGHMQGGMHPMQLQHMQPGPSMQQQQQQQQGQQGQQGQHPQQHPQHPQQQQQHQGGQQMGSPMQGMSPVSSPTQPMQPPSGISVQSPLGQSMGSPMGGSMQGSPMQQMGSSPVSPMDEHRLMELSPPGNMMGGDCDNSPVGSLPNMTSMPSYIGSSPGTSCYHPAIGPRHSTGCVRLAPTITHSESHSAPTSPQQSNDLQQPPGWPNRHFSFSNSPEVIDIPNIVLTGADGGAGELDCFQDLQDLHLDPTEMQMLCNASPDTCCETQLLRN